MNGDHEVDKAQKTVSKMDLAGPEARFDNDSFENHFQISSWPTMVLLDEHHRIVPMGEPGQPPHEGQQLSTTLAKLPPDRQ